MKKVLCLLAAVCLLCSCGLFGESAETPAPEITSVSETEPTPYPLTVNGTVIVGSPEKIVCLSPSLCEILYEFGEGSRLAGRGGYCDYPPEIKSVRDLGSGLGIDVSAVIDISPDLLLSSAPVSAKDAMALESAGIAIVTLPPPKNIEQFGDVYRMFGVILYGAFTGAERGESVFSEISHVFDNSDAIDLKNFVYITENLDVAGNTFEGSVLSCFGNNLAENSDGYGFDRESLIQNQPNVVLLNGAYSAEELLADEVYSRLDAVINGRVIIIDNARFERPSARICDMLGGMVTEYNMMRG